MDSVRALQIERLRQMTADQKARMAHALWIQARDAAAAGVRAKHPQWSEAEVLARVRDLMRDAGA